MDQLHRLAERFRKLLTDRGFQDLRGNDIGDATGRSGRNIELFIFSCQVDFSTGRVRAVDVRIR